MAKTYQQLMNEIAALQQKAEAVRKSEIDGVIERIKLAISHYGLTAADLGLGGGARKTARGASGAAARPQAATAPAGNAQYRDDKGNSWSGRGPRPGWLKAAIAAGRSLDEFRVASAAGPRARRAAGKTGPKITIAPKYRDDAGNTWTGRGSRPRWVQAALAEGKTLDDLRIPA